MLTDPPPDCLSTDPSLPDPVSPAHAFLYALVDLDLQAAATLFPISLVGACFATSTKCSQGHDHGEFAEYWRVRALYGHVSDRQLKIMTAPGYLAGGPTNLRLPPRQLPCATCLLAKEGIAASIPAIPPDRVSKMTYAGENICVDNMGPIVYKPKAGEPIGPEMNY